MQYGLLWLEVEWECKKCGDTFLSKRKKEICPKCIKEQRNGKKISAKNR